MGYYSTITLPFGQAYLVEQNRHLTHLLFEKEDLSSLINLDLQKRDTELLKNAKLQLEEYFKEKRKVFTIPLSLEGTAFQKKVWGALLSIPYGESRSYSDIAHAIGKPTAVRAIGQANKKNAIPIMVPCHRVIGKNRTLTGYAGNEIDKKALLLDIEKISYQVN
ncbi:methylated-DNA--[protein]-cysteine S-methyltransferase [Bacillus changyiensis]|uniref:methylated-DNA--[protein]-cysteine S-methyltransferase n=1 Tax=Bacillus changyiensis TaxID=3004103 RepID=UPI0022E3AF98|nr:methylated-DNA--[protein]-cysteine S-methyltransferase [Bacillus changyiensis]MDA1475799.1 methylated-DNA--[protein]-cysteine S-methyltransferase [Bacillus changyiensis]